MPTRKSLNATALILTAAGLALIAIATILMIEAGPTSLPAGNALSDGPSARSIARAGAAGYSAASDAALGLLQAGALGAIGPTVAARPDLKSAPMSSGGARETRN